MSTALIEHNERHAQSKKEIEHYVTDLKSNEKLR